MPVESQREEELIVEMPWRIELLGGLKARRDDRVIARFSTHKTGTLLACLAYYQQRAHTREELAELLWPEVAPEVGRHNLRQALLSLRRQLQPPGAAANAGAPFMATRAEVRLSPGVTTDVGEFEAALKAAAQARDSASEAEALAGAVELYRGSLLPGHYDEWVLIERERLAESCWSALHRLTRLLHEAGDLERALQYGRSAVGMDPLREESHGDLIRLFLAAGRPADALRQYRELERILREELGDTPSGALTSLVRQLPAFASRRAAPPRPPAGIGAQEGRSTERERSSGGADRRRGRELSPASGPDGAGRVATHLAPAPRLPLFSTRFFGREAELERLDAMLRHPETRLITLTGPGGSGKTRLAVEAARRAADGFEGSVWFVPLADRTDASLLPDAIGEAMLSPGEARVLPALDEIEAFLNQRAPAPALLVLDSFEHLIEAGVAIIAALMERAPHLTCLVSSRQRLEIAGEHELVVLPLPLPLSTLNPPTSWVPELSTLLTCPSVQLFVDRAQASRPDFAVTPRNAAAVSLLCQRLEGIPLALELAAARAQMLTPSQMLAQLEARFDFLVSRRRDIAPRHRTLRAALAWSYELLPADLRQFFARLSVFHGRWTLEAAAAICSDHAWFQDVPEHPAGQVLEFLTELRDRSLIVATPGDDEMEYRMLEMLREYAAEQLAPVDRDALRRQHAEYFLEVVNQADPNLHGPEQGAWMDRLEADHDNFRAALAWSRDEPGAIEIALCLAGGLHFFWHVRAHVPEGRRWLRELLAIPAGMAPTAARAAALYGGAGLATVQGDLHSARRLYEECLAIRRALGDRKPIADTLCQSGHVAERLGVPEQARALYAESRLIYREIGDKGGLAHVVKCIGAQAMAAGDEEQARSLFEECLKLYRELGDPRGVAMALGEMGQLALLQGKDEQAAAVLKEHLALSRQLKDAAHTALALRNLGYAIRNQGDIAGGRQLLQESLALRRELGDQGGIAELLAHLGYLACLEREPAAARACFAECLAVLQETGEYGAAVSLLNLLVGSILNTRGDTGVDPPTARRAARLLAAAEALRTAAGAGDLWPAEHTMRERAIAAARAAVDETAFSTAWAEGSAMSREEAIAEARCLEV